MTMRAIRVAQYGGPEVLKLEEVPIPKPKDGEVLIRVFAAGVNPVDTYIRSGNFGQDRQMPYTPGDDVAGIVEQIGSGVTEFKRGDRVYSVGILSGGYAEYAIGRPSNMALLDHRLSFAQGACIGVPYHTAYKALFIRAHAQPGDTVLIHGASGAVGIAAVQIAKAHGMRVLGTAGTAKGTELVKKIGADHVFNHKAEGYMEMILQATSGKGVDVILEMLADVNLNMDLEILAFRGRVVVVGCRGNIEINPRLAMFRENSIMGIALMAGPEDEWKLIMAGTNAGQSAGWLTPVVAREYKLEDAAQAQNDVINNTGTFGKLVLDTTK